MMYINNTKIVRAGNKDAKSLSNDARDKLAKHQYNSSVKAKDFSINVRLL